jgi:hypothetical protein
MRVLLELEPTTDLDALVAGARAAHAAGLDGVLLREAPGLRTPLLAAAAIAPAVPDLRLAVELELGAQHPFELAEEVAVVDLSADGRLLLVARPAPDADSEYAEALDLVRTALAARPFSFQGGRWQVPANLPENEFRIDDQVRLMPPPAQFRLEVWGAGAGRDAALARGLGHLADADADGEELGAAYAAAEAALGPALIGAVRARRETLGTAQDLVERLRAGRAAFGQDCAVVAGDAATAAVLGRAVLPRVQLNRLPPGLEDYWNATGVHA